MKKTVKKAQKGDKVAKYVSPYKSEKTADSTQYFRDKNIDIYKTREAINSSSAPNKSAIVKDYDKEMKKSKEDFDRQGLKGKKGFDKYGNPITYKQASASKKRAGGKVVAKSGAKVVKKTASKKK